MIRWTVVVLAFALIAGSSGAADAKGICLPRALEQGYAFRNGYGAVVYRPHLPTADDYAACGLAVPTAIVERATPAFAG